MAYAGDLYFGMRQKRRIKVLTQGTQAPGHKSRYGRLVANQSKQGNCQTRRPGKLYFVKRFFVSEK